MVVFINIVNGRLVDVDVDVDVAAAATADYYYPFTCAPPINERTNDLGCAIDSWSIQRQRLDNFRILFGALLEFLQRQLVVSVLSGAAGGG